MLVAEPQISANDRFSFTLFLAIALHALMIFGISFGLNNEQSATRILDVTIAQYRSDEAPEQADYLAQVNQQGSGTLDEKALPTTTEQAEFNSNIIERVAPQALASAPEPTEDAIEAIISTIDSNQVLAKATRDQLLTDKRLPKAEQSITEISHEIASLQAQLDAQKQKYANRPKTLRITAVSAKKSNTANYLDNFRRRIEFIGNEHYPNESKKHRIYGNVRLLVTLNPNGTIDKITVLSSSGRNVLDDAAIRSVRNSAPFPPFPAKLRREYDFLEIIRTWKFYNNRLSTGH